DVVVDAPSGMARLRRAALGGGRAAGGAVPPLRSLAPTLVRLGLGGGELLRTAALARGGARRLPLAQLRAHLGRARGRFPAFLLGDCGIFQRLFLRRRLAVVRRASLAGSHAVSVAG